MRKVLFAAAAVFALSAGHEAKAIGCLTGAAAGAFAGHAVGHGILGAVGGCIAGHQWHKHSVNKEQLSNTAAYDAQRKKSDPNYESPWQQ
jgi:outer membrane lipoprotein SlyB